MFKKTDFDYDAVRCSVLDVEDGTLLIRCGAHVPKPYAALLALKNRSIFLVLKANLFELELKRMFKKTDFDYDASP